MLGAEGFGMLRLLRGLQGLFKVDTNFPFKPLSPKSSIVKSPKL